MTLEEGNGRKRIHVVVRYALALDRQRIRGILVVRSDALGPPEVLVTHLQSAIGQSVLSVVPEGSAGDGRGHIVIQGPEGNVFCLD